ncbi:3-keto-5-aminohexanoate cleavage protein [Halomonas sp. BM-2019]|uniref:3-keto-5-aminohexanoate cleavage protein n=1 Tax=Halomonas sp. BM-2019 TaxID=2811227 RepID=UPI0031FCE97E
MAAGGHTRTGLGDSLRRDRATLAPNAALVERAAALCEKCVPLLPGKRPGASSAWDSQ